jgi:hypothetical protein
LIGAPLFALPADSFDSSRVPRSIGVAGDPLSGPAMLHRAGRQGRPRRPCAVIRETIRSLDQVALGRVVLTSREPVIGLEARDKGLMGMLLRYPYEVRIPPSILMISRR